MTTLISCIDLDKLNKPNNSKIIGIMMSSKTDEKEILDFIQKLNPNMFLSLSNIEIQLSSGEISDTIMEKWGERFISFEDLPKFKADMDFETQTDKNEMSVN
jgi:hypothetical protein